MIESLLVVIVAAIVIGLLAVWACRAPSDRVLERMHRQSSDRVERLPDVNLSVMGARSFAAVAVKRLATALSLAVVPCVIVQIDVPFANPLLACLLFGVFWGAALGTMAGGRKGVTVGAILGGLFLTPIVFVVLYYVAFLNLPPTF
jgi:hypothetical protein